MEVLAVVCAIVIFFVAFIVFERRQLSKEMETLKKHKEQRRLDSS